MSRKRFQEILKYFHVADNNSLNENEKFTMVRPLLNILNSKWLQYYPKDPYISIDESMVKYFGRHGAKQHIHNKPIRFGFKVWSLCTRLGYLIQAEHYQGASTENTRPILGLEDLLWWTLCVSFPMTSHTVYMLIIILPLLGWLKSLAKQDLTVQAPFGRPSWKSSINQPQRIKKTAQGKLWSRN